MLSIREKIAHKLNITVEQLQLATQDRWLDTSDNNKLVHQMGFTDNQVLTTKVQSNLSNTYSKVAEVRTTCVQLYSVPTNAIIKKIVKLVASLNNDNADVPAGHQSCRCTLYVLVLLHVHVCAPHYRACFGGGGVPL